MKKTVYCKDFEIDYCMIGSGKKPFVMLPGISLQSVIPSEALIGQAYEMFLKEYTIYLIDRNKYPKQDYSFDEFCEDTAKVLQTIGIKDAYVFGVSLGGMCAEYLAIHYPELVKKVILASTIHQMNDMGRKFLHDTLDLCEAKDIYHLYEYFYEHLYRKDTIEAALKANPNIYHQGTLEELKVFEVFIRLMIPLDLEEDIDGIRCPVYVIGANEDVVFGPEASKILAQKTKGKLYLYDDYGHAVYDEAPDYKQRIYDFFKD